MAFHRAIERSGNFCCPSLTGCRSRRRARWPSSGPARDRPLSGDPHDNTKRCRPGPEYRGQGGGPTFEREEHGADRRRSPTRRILRPEIGLRPRKNSSGSRPETTSLRICLSLSFSGRMWRWSCSPFAGRATPTEASGVIANNSTNPWFACPAVTVRIKLPFRSCSSEDLPWDMEQLEARDERRQESERQDRVQTLYRCAISCETWG